ncbi:MAG TPA: hypothetical protein VJB65_01520 [Patescibacteria group bacterium]|nr:hypothetical protein [Patescibacteria group bacterium]
MVYFLKQLFFVSISIACMCYPTLALAGIGISPSQLKQDRLLSGSTTITEFTLSRSDADTALPLQLRVTGSAASLLSIQEGNFVTIAAQEKTTTFHIITNIPTNTVYGIYSAAISIVSDPHAVVFDETGQNSTTAKSSTVATELQLSIPVILTVQEKEITEYTISDILSQPIEAQQPIILSFTVQNAGNLPARPDMLNIRITNLEDGAEQILLYNEPLLIDEVAPFHDQTQRIAIPSTLAMGQYRADVTISDTKHNVSAHRTLVLEVLAAGSLYSATAPIDVQPEMYAASSDKHLTGVSKYTMIAFFIAVFFLIGVLAIGLFHYHKQQQKQRKDS